MILAIQEHPVILAEQLMRRIDDTGFDIGRRVKDLPGHVTGGCDDDEPMEVWYQPLSQRRNDTRLGNTYLWKTETQLSSPLSHLALYSWNLGLTD